MKPALAVLVRADSITSVGAELDKLTNLLANARELAEFEWVYLVAVAHKAVPEAKHKLTSWASAHVKPVKFECYAPNEVTDLSLVPLDLQGLSDYLLNVLHKIVFKSGCPELKFLWLDDWPQAMVAVAGLAAATERISWWLPRKMAKGMVPWPTVPSGFKYQDLWLPAAESTTMAQILGESDAIRDLRNQLEAAARHSVPVLLIGETGSGKELCASALHELSGRSGRFLPVNCALLDTERAESILFGHVKGAFTGADKDRDGRVREARNGTLFLDEMLELPLPVQAKLLRATNQVEQARLNITSMGANETAADSIDVRVVSAVQADLDEEKAFRSDLYQRLSWLQIELPPLRKRHKDAAVIARKEFARLTQVQGERPLDVHEDVYELLCNPGFHSWPGNVRELRKVVFRAWHAAATSQAKAVTATHVEFAVGRRKGPPALLQGDLRRAVSTFIVSSGTAALARAAGNKSKAAEALGFKTGQEFERYVERHREKLEGKGEDGHD